MQLGQFVNVVDLPAWFSLLTSFQTDHGPCLTNMYELGLPNQLSVKANNISDGSRTVMVSGTEFQRVGSEAAKLLFFLVLERGTISQSNCHARVQA